MGYEIDKNVIKEFLDKRKVFLKEDTDSGYDKYDECTKELAEYLINSNHNLKLSLGEFQTIKVKSYEGETGVIVSLDYHITAELDVSSSEYSQIRENDRYVEGPLSTVKNIMKMFKFLSDYHNSGNIHVFDKSQYKNL